MHSFSLKIVLVAIAIPLLIFLTYWHFVVAGKGIEDIVSNVISDIVFAIFIVLFIEYANERDREQRNKSRRRAGALAIQKFYQEVHSIVAELVRDGILSSAALSLPTEDTIKQRAESLQAKDVGSIGSFEEDPASYASFFVTHFTGNSKANVYPSRSSREYVAHLANNLDKLYADALQMDGGLLPDEIVDALTRLKQASLFIFLRHLNTVPFGKFGYWPGAEVQQISGQLEKLQTYFGKILGHNPSPYKVTIFAMIQNGLNFSKSQKS